MRRNKDFSVALLLSSYFNPKGQESLPEVRKRFGEPFTLITLYKHTQNHMKANVARWMRVNGLEEKKNWHLALEKTRVATADKLEVLESTMTVIDTPTDSQQQHEMGLDEFIAKGRESLDTMNVTASTYLQAIKIKAEIESKTKDRRFDALKTIFAGAAPKDNDSAV